MAPFLPSFKPPLGDVRYRITAVDRSARANESPPSATVTVRTSFRGERARSARGFQPPLPVGGRGCRAGDTRGVASTVRLLLFAATPRHSLRSWRRAATRRVDELVRRASRPSGSALRAGSSPPPRRRARACRAGDTRRNWHRRSVDYCSRPPPRRSLRSWRRAARRGPSIPGRGFRYSCSTTRSPLPAIHSPFHGSGTL